MKKGRVTIPTNLDVVPQTLEILDEWGADAIRDCDGTEFPKELKDTGSKIYATYYTTRKDNEWAKAHPEEIQQMYIMTSFHTATEDKLEIHLMDHLYPDMLAVNTRDDIYRWWEVIDRTTGEPVSTELWSYEEETGNVVIRAAKLFHEYTVSFLAYIMWDPVHMYNAVVNDWKDVEPQITFDVRQPKTKAYSLERLRRFLDTHEYVDVVRFTTFFHQFTLIFDELAREKYVDWFGYSASVSPYILEQFEKEVGYPFRPEYIIDQGYMNNTYRIPSKEFKDFQAFQRREVAKLAKEMVDIVHEYGKEAMMFMGDHWIGMEPFMDEFASIGLDAVVGSVGNGATLRLFSDIKNVKYTEGRFLPYFFPDTFHEGGDPVKEAKVNWVTARRAILRSPIQRIGYGGYLKLALEFPDFVQYIKEVCEEFRTLYDNIQGTTPYCVKRVAVLNCWGKMRSWGNHMVHHAIYYKQNYSYFGIIEALSGAPFDVSFISFDDIKADKDLLKKFDVVINVGDADTAQSGGENWIDETIITAVREFVYNGGGFIGVGEPAAHQWQGRFIQLDDVLGVEEEHGFNLNTDKYNWEEHRNHFILKDAEGEIDFGEGKKNIYALPETEILIQKDQEVQMAVKTFGKGRGVYISGLPYSFKNSRILYRAVLWSASAEEELHCWYSTNYNVEVHAYVKNGKYCVVNNTYEPQDTVVYRGDGSSFWLHMEANEIKWYQI
ncbi:1,3-beta-galactosyl-N-acetylhexosamine phosphorylase [Blautia wexlerae]|uniref:1,3-beta-galactosyl-N-acetylhexosamine phosphorylase n=1 Tax=Blautia wexlerae TaxID=418240 RepID=UPI00156F4658|nr:1,3-beta-galactosyl-N-acetylhexosamine phosphorylase [Blautia wexlerae]MCB5687676.1 1,3-beta-galactosyl-N-acetylhexosamine phosphorylase [Blautia wexlerae]NSD01197.1 1,3-beta-galactosyl-N-acetylhexosamine phosphorylase [Blautia wexlerae]NSE92507.1 1,3-beta-galactosyl-N-acetylhexosamine phosphorylase [Blautia wexlerae]NSF35304.1 1,3-beta-galactosyl-N-acetylhexosamine phosphorylase [Blautia wexlerae]NSF42300.1 1,3-beta-galactosyl-N-acetylhexosamine phosphorylase [Blautia wexlerae]